MMVSATFLWSLPSLAEKITVDTSTLTPEVLTQVLKAGETAKTTSMPVLTPESAAEWAAIGKNIGTALSEAAGAMSVGVNEFSQTFVGKLTVILIVWKVIGQDLWSIFGGTALWITLTSIIAWSYRRHHFSYPVETPGHGEEMVTTYRTTVQLDDSEQVVSMWVHLIMFAVSTIACMVIVF